jgi:glycosyltransferase involved in cell wall biosynthesis
VRYWLLTTEYPPHFGGGIGTYCEQWSHLLHKKGHEITVFLANRNISKIKEHNANGIRVVEFSPFLKDLSSFLGFESTQSYSFAEVVKLYIEREGTPDWLEAQEYNGIAYYLLQRKHLGEVVFKDLKVLITCHAPSFLYFEFNHINPYQLPYFWIGEMEKYCIQAADVNISPSQYLVDRLKERHTFNKECVILHNPYSFEEADDNYDFTDTAVFIAKLSPSKGILQTLKAFKQLWETGSTVKLKLIGDKNYYYHAKQCLMNDFIVQNFKTFIDKGLLKVTGSLKPSELYAEIKSAKIVLIPSTVDNFPYTVVESMSSKKVVVVSMQGGQREIIEDGINGFLFDHNHPGQFVEKLKHALSLQIEEVKELVQNASETIRKKCNPDTYYIDKIAVLNSFKYTDTRNDFFPFTRSDNQKSTHVEIEGVNSKHGLLSIVIPYYNMGKWIDETIDSIYKSSYKNIEIIIVNDGSNDPASNSKLTTLQADQRITIINQTNSGLAEARNIGAMTAKGDYLAFLDGDDKVAVNYFEKAIDILSSKNNVYFVGSWVHYFEGSDQIWPGFTPEPPYLLYHNMINSSGLVYKRNQFIEAGLNDRNFVYGMEDYDSVINLVKNGFKGVVIPEVLFYYRVRKNSMARNFNINNKSYLYQLLANKHREYYAMYASELANLLNANGPGYSVENPTMDYHLHNSSIFRNKYFNKLYTKIKQQSFLRKIAIKTFKIIK